MNQISFWKRILLLGAAAVLVPVAVAQARSVERRIVVCVDTESARIRLVGNGSCGQGEIRRTWPVSGPAPQLCIDKARRLSMSAMGACVDSEAKLIRMREGARFVACANKETGEMRRPSRWSKFTCAATSRTVRWIGVPRKSAAITTTTTSTSTTTTTAVVNTSASIASFGLNYEGSIFDIVGSSEVLAPTVTNGVAASYSYTGTLPTGVSFDTTTGEFTGATEWNKYLSSIAGGYEAACAVTTLGGAKCWGLGRFYGIGDGFRANRGEPVDVLGLTTGVESIDAGYLHFCAVTMAGGVKCWGHNNYGQLGDGSTSDQLAPVQVVGLTSGIELVRTSKTDGVTCALTTAGGVKCWGRNHQGQLGDGTSTDSDEPVDVTGLTSGVSRFAIGGAHACALLSVGTIKCWGDNVAGQLGDGSVTDSFLPVTVAGISNATAIGAGSQHTCALLDTGGVQCWGANNNGALGDPSVVMFRSTPGDVVGLTSGVTRLSVGQAHNCVIMSATRGLKCWGINTHGNLGVGDTLNRSTPTDVVDLASGVLSVDAGGWMTCVVALNYQGKCFGIGNSGGLGDGGWSSSSTAVDVRKTGPNVGFPAAVSVTATSTTGRTATWSGTVDLVEPPG
jgi:alpha-tubulin suppressor-like RCC1 family protein